MAKSVLTLVGVRWLAAGCSTAYRVIAIPAPADRVSLSDAWHSEDYQCLLAAISTVMVRELDFPPIQGVVLFYSNYRTYEAGLAEELRAGARRSEERSKHEIDADRSEQIAGWARQHAFTTAGVAINCEWLLGVGRPAPAKLSDATGCGLRDAVNRCARLNLPVRSGKRGQALASRYVLRRA